ncbi:MAG: hypothetical protein ACFE9X_09430 [Promethearchaeota archaeon]
MRKKNKILLLSFVLIINGMILFSSVFKDNLIKSEIDKGTQGPGNLHFKNFKISDYSPNYLGIGEKVNITLQQSLLNNSLISFSDLDIDNTFTEPCPTVNNFNSSFINILIEDIKADNISSVVQNNPDDGEIDCATTRLTSFSVSANSYIINASINIRRTANPTGDIYLYASSWNSVLNRSEPTGIPTTIGTITPTVNGWLYIDLIDTFLNNSNTDNKTWFFGVVRTSGGGSIQWRYTDDSPMNNNSYAYYTNAGWIYEPRDYLLEIGLAPINTTPNPQDIGLKINNTQVINYGVGSGYWTSIGEFQSSSGILSFKIVSDWKALSLNITEVQINYTKTDLQASSEFNVFKGASKISWNVSRTGGFNYFDPKINDHTTINFTIPANWNDINVFNSTVNKTNNILIRNLNNVYKEVQVLNAGNGTFWFLNATSSNLLQSIDTFENSNPTTIFNYSSIIHFNATFSKKIAQNDGIINLSVYSPAAINDELNFTETYTSFGPASKISLNDWDVSDNITQYGIFRVQVSWNNDSDAGFLEKNITIIGETDLTLIKPLQNASFNSDQIFNITVYFHDSGLNKSIDGTLWYSINSEIWQSTINNNGTTGYYNITIDCSTLYPYGPQNVSLSLNQTYYYNKSLDYYFNLIGISELTLISPAQNSFFTPNQRFNITVYYNDTLNNQPINGTMWYSINGETWESTTNNNGTTGYYNITIDCSKLYSYGSQNVSISINHTSYQNKTLEYKFSVVGLSELTLVAPNQNATFYSDQFFKVSVYYNDTINDKPINGTMWYSINGGVWQSTTKNNGTDGYYNISIDCSILVPYGPQSVSISLNHTDYQNKTLVYNFKVIGVSDLTLITPNQNATFYSDQIFNITVYYNSTTNNQPINGTMWYSINGGSWQYTADNNGTTGYYSITIECNTFDPYGPQSVSISLNQTYYQNKTLYFNFTIIGLTELILISPSQNQLFSTNQTFSMIVYFNDTLKNQPINGIMWYSINGGIWQSTATNNGTAGYYNVTIDCSSFDPYGSQSVSISLNQTYYQNKTLDYNFKVICLTELNITNPIQFINKFSDELFNITVYFYDNNKVLGITGANISYNVNGTVYNYVYEVGNGYYNITIYNWQVRSDTGYGLIDITINANKTNYFNQTSVYHYYLYNATTQLIDQDTLNVIRSQNVTFTSYYLFNDSTPILGANLQMISINSNFIYTWGDNGDGSYYIELGTTNVLGMGNIPYTIIFNISSQFNQTQVYSVNLYVWNRTDYIVNNLSQTNYSYYLNSEPWIIYYGEDVTFNISYFDTDNGDELISGAWGNFTLFNSTKNWDPILIYTDINGFYIFTLNTSDLFTGIYNVKVKLNSTYFNSTISIFQFEIIACNVSANILSLIQYGSTINLNNTIYEAYFGDNITIYMSFLNSFSNTSIIGGFGNLTFNNQSIFYSDIDKDGIYIWELNSSNLEFGRYSFTVNFNKVNFQNHSFEIFFDINKFNINITIVEQPDEVAPGNIFSITLNITNQFIGEPISNLNISILVDFGTISWEATNVSLSNGLIYFYVFVPNNATLVNITIQFLGDNSFNASEIVFSIKIKAEDNGNIISEFLLIALYLILIIGAVVGSGLFIIYRKKRLSSSESIVEEDHKLLASMKSEEEFKESLQEEIVIKKSIEATKQINKLIKKQVDIDNGFKILSLDRLKGKMESKISAFIEKAEEIKKLEEREVIVEKLDKVGLMEQIEQIEFKEFKNSIRKLNNEGLDLLKKGELKKSLEKYKKIRDLLSNYFK